MSVICPRSAGILQELEVSAALVEYFAATPREMGLANWKRAKGNLGLYANYLEEDFFSGLEN